MRTRFFVTLRRACAAAVLPTIAAFAADCRGATRSDAAGTPETAIPVTSAPPAVPVRMPIVDAPPAARPACPAGMTEVSGSYCTVLWHWCLEGYPSIGAPWTKFPGGQPGVEYCEKYVPGKAVCKGAERPLRFCIDTYEQPGKDRKPDVMVSWYEAERRCKAQGRRLCNDDEWTLACEGPQRTPYPYGWERDDGACNIGKTLPPHRDNAKIYSKDPAVSQAELDRLDLRVPSGSMPRCVSPFGVYDMTGNADEWCRDVTTRGASMDHAPYVSVFKGGHMLGRVRNRCRPATTAHGPDFYYHVEGFRCCADPAK